MIDLGGVHRLGDESLARRWYGVSPGAWSYGLPEVHPATGRLIANPGCYATAALLALWPLHEVIDGDVIVDAKSGMTGAGKTLRERSHAGSVLENFAPYALDGHRHAPEIAQVLGLPVTFVPHLLPVRRGLLATCYLRSSADVRSLIEAAYAGSEVVRVLPEGIEPEIRRVQGTDAAELGVFTDCEHRHGDRHLRARQPRQGRGGPGGPEREPGARPARDQRPAARERARMRRIR